MESIIGIDMLIKSPDMGLVLIKSLFCSVSVTSSHNFPAFRRSRARAETPCEGARAAGAFHLLVRFRRGRIKKRAI